MAWKGSIWARMGWVLTRPGLTRNGSGATILTRTRDLGQRVTTLGLACGSDEPANADTRNGRSDRFGVAGFGAPRAGQAGSAAWRRAEPCGAPVDPGPADPRLDGHVEGVRPLSAERPRHPRHRVAGSGAPSGSSTAGAGPYPEANPEANQARAGQTAAAAQGPNGEARPTPRGRAPARRRGYGRGRIGGIEARAVGRGLKRGFGARRPA